MLNPQTTITWRRKWFRCRRQLQRYNIRLLALAVMFGLMLLVILYRTMMSAAEINGSVYLRRDSDKTRKLTPIPSTAKSIVIEERNPEPIIKQAEAAIIPTPVSTPIPIQKVKIPTSLPVLSVHVSLEDKRKAVRDAVLHAWTGYKKDAFGHDELLPLSHSFSDNWGSLAWTLIDSLGTLYICGLMNEFTIARDFIANMKFDQINSDVSVFETNIRILGGLLSAFELSGDYMFVDQARIVGNALMPAFQTSSGLPSSKINLATGRQSGGWLGLDTVILSEFGSLQMEFSALSHHTDDPKYMTAAMNIYEVLKKHTSGGLLTTEFNLKSGRPSNNVLTVGALSDSYYEYLLKLYIMSDRTIPAALDMYIKAVDELIDKLVIEWEEPHTNKKRARIVQRTNGMIENKMEHLSCFVPGMLALGAHYGELHGIESLLQRKDRHMDLAIKLLDTCVQMYTMTATQLPAEYIEFANGGFQLGDDSRYLLRPETVESLFILYRITKNESYRDAGWNIFTAIERHCRTDTAYAAVQNVNSRDVPAPKLDNMESFVMAETFKYLYLLFSPDTFIPLEHFVFTTEAHPLRITKASKIKLNIDPVSTTA